MGDVGILETTLRDGSYAINFQFTANDTAVIASELEEVGFEYIEIGHGVGLGASRNGMGEAAETDVAYLEAAAGALSRAKYGMFCIPGVASLDDIDMAAEMGMGFIRIGTNVTEMEESRDYIERAKRHDLFVTTNFMKSYTLEPKQFAEKAKLSQKFGSDLLYIVDSAGGMLKEEIEGYFRAVRDVSDIPLGYHGHDNLGCAISHSLFAAELGASLIDGSLQGLGRSAGNAATEILVVALKRMGYEMAIDPLKVMDISETYIKPLISKRGLDSIDVVTGYAQFHSSYMSVIKKYASKYRIDPRRLIIGVCEHDKVNAPEWLVEDVARRLRSESERVYVAKYKLHEYFGNEQSNDLGKK
ncbi:MAG: 4-hydroxy-2-oxovalerate aldolase [Deltaproteobacteria bacterium]|nr:4-hydroxy-2-oxovalerate aldolase [Deltaproteobacteria bacterium]MBW2063929.1 4-hydroxy-2-oxovalerate aldolase [Deltaproteobacteria bacterium]